MSSHAPAVRGMTAALPCASGLRTAAKCAPKLSWRPPGCRELRLALLLAAQVTRHHGLELAAHVGRLHRALRPEGHAQWGPGVGPEYPELDCDHSPGSLYGGYEEEGRGLSSSGGSSGAAGSGGSPSLAGGGGLPSQPPSAFLANAPGRVLPHPAARWAMSASTLRFGDERLEQRFQLWRNSRLARVRFLQRRPPCCLCPLQPCSSPQLAGWNGAALCGLRRVPSPTSPWQPAPPAAGGWRRPVRVSALLPGRLLHAALWRVQLGAPERVPARGADSAGPTLPAAAQPLNPLVQPPQVRWQQAGPPLRHDTPTPTSSSTTTTTMQQSATRAQLWKAWG